MKNPLKKLFQDPNSVVIDHLNFAVSKNEMDHTLIASDLLLDSPVILGDKTIQVGPQSV